MQGCLGCNPARGIVSQHSLHSKHLYVEQVDSKGVQVQAVYYLLNGVGTPVGEGRAVLFQLGDSGPHFLVRRPQDPEDAVQLVDVTVSLEQGLLRHHLCKNAPDRPNIDGGRVLDRPK